MDVYNELPPDLPRHKETALAARPARTIATWPIGTFVENLIIRKNGELVVSIHSEEKLETIGPDGTHHTLAQFDAPPTSMIELDPDLLVLGGAPGQSPGYLWRVSPGGTVTKWLEVPSALFLNGSVPFLPGFLLTVDSLLGTIFRIDLHSRSVSPWFSHELLTKITSFPFMPGGNGLKIFGNHVYVSNTDRALLLRIPILPPGDAGPIEVVAEHLRADDFAFDRDGNAYLATHIENTIVRLCPSGERLAVAGPEQGMPGCTAVRFGRTASTREQLFVTTTGGLIGPYRGVAQQAKLVVLDLGVEGDPIDFLEAM